MRHRRQCDQRPRRPAVLACGTSPFRITERLPSYPDAVQLLRAFHSEQVDRYGFADPVELSSGEYTPPNGSSPWPTRAPFAWPAPGPGQAPTVGDTLHHLMASRGWPGAGAWRAAAQRIAPTIVGGSKKHGGPDLGPTRARAAWAQLGVDGLGIADAPPGADAPADHGPRLTSPMVALLQGLPAG
jgi:hypothetical protein